jgi:hypothetical protein
VAPDSAAASTLAEKHLAFIGAHFQCTHAMHACIGRMYAEEPGYGEYYDALEPGLTEWLCAAIAANARAHGVDPESATWD